MNTIFERFVIFGLHEDDTHCLVWSKVKAFAKLKDAREHLKTIGNHDPSRHGFQTLQIKSPEGRIYATKDCYDRNGRAKARELAKQYRQISLDLSAAARAKTELDRIRLTKDILEKLEQIRWTPTTNSPLETQPPEFAQAG